MNEREGDSASLLSGYSFVHSIPLAPEYAREAWEFLPDGSRKKKHLF
jgi:hypothetical protein